MRLGFAGNRRAVALRPIAMGSFGRRSFLCFCLASARALKLTAQSQESGAALLKQFQFESKLWPNLHHFLYILGRARNGAFDSGRVAVKQAPLDTAGFGALSESQRKAWEHAIGIYQVHASPLDIGYGGLVDVNYAVADLPASGRIEDAKGISAELRAALAEAGPVYRGLWWPRHDAANLDWISQLKPQVERYGPRIKERLTAAFRTSWPTLPLRVEVVAYADPRGAYTTADPPLIAISSLNPQHQGIDGLEQLFHECSHLMMDTVEAALKARAKAVGKDLSREVSHTILFYTVADTLRTLIPDRVPYPDHYGVWNRGWTRYHELLGLYWQPYLDGKSTMEDAIDRLVRNL
jgi:hypothetical protein